MTVDLDFAVRTLAGRIAAGCPYSLFLGAGASKPSGAPTGGDIIAELKRDLFEAKNERLAKNDRELEEWWNAEKGPSATPDYQEVLKRRFPDPKERRIYFEKKLSKLPPKDGHKALARLMTAHSTRDVLSLTITTNFDWLIESAIAQVSGEWPCEYDQAQYLPSSLPKPGVPIVLKVHGDYFYDDIANLKDELNERMQSAMRNALQQALNGRGLVVLGYEGQDDLALRRELHTLLERDHSYLSHGIWWIYRPSNDAPNPPDFILDTIQKVRHSGREGYVVVVPGNSFCSFMIALEQAVLPAHSEVTSTDPLAQYALKLRKRLSQQTFRYYEQELLPGPLPSSRLLEYLDSDRIVVVTGESGCGKSSMIAALALDLLNEHRVPILHELSRGNTKLDLGDEQDALLQESPGRCVLFVDALDQVDGAINRNQILHEVCSKAKGGCPVLVTSKPVVPELAEYSPRFEFAELGKEQTIAFVALLCGDEVAAGFKHQLECEESTRPDIVQLCRRAMLLAMLATNFHETGCFAGKFRLYERVVNRLLQSRINRLNTKDPIRLREAANQLGYNAELPQSDSRLLTIKDSNEMNQLRNDLESCGLIRFVRKDWEFLHRSFQPYFAACAILNELNVTDPAFKLAGGLTRSELNDFLGSYFDELGQVEKLFSLIKKAPKETAAPINLWYALSFCSGSQDAVQRFARQELDRCRWESPQPTVRDSQLLLNSALAGWMAGSPWCVGAWYKILRSDRCDESWNVCKFGGPYHAASPTDKWRADDELKVLRDATPSADPEALEELRQVLMHTGHLACQGLLDNGEDFRLAITGLTKLSWGSEQWRIVINIIAALYRLPGDREAILTTLLDAFGLPHSYSLGWRIPRELLRAIMFLLPTDPALRKRTADFITELLPLLRTWEKWERELLQVQCIIVLTKMGMPIPKDGFDSTPAIKAARAWRVNG